MTALILPDPIGLICGEALPAAARPAGYAALVAAYRLSVPAPDELVAIGERHTYRQEGRWRILTPRYQPAETVAAHLEFALRHQGVDLAVLNALFQTLAPEVIEEWVRSEPTGQYARRTWFLYEWLTGRRLDLADAPRAPYAAILDPQQHYAITGEMVTRHRVRNNLPGTSDFCPLVRRTETLDGLLRDDLANEARAVVQRTAPDLMARAAAFLLLQDSKASYVIEGERPPQDRIQRWGQAISEAGQAPLTDEQLLRLQRIVIGDARFTHMGWRLAGGFVGSRDRDTNAPLPDHISARPDDLKSLIGGLIAYDTRSEIADGALNPVIAAAAVAFGFVFIHPFEDGNGRIHRWLVHHVLGRRGFNPRGIVFPVSAVFLERLEDYKAVLEHYSRPRLALTQWETTPQLNVHVLNETRDFFRFFDATRQAEFLAQCVVHTIRNTLPQEIDYLRRYDVAKRRVEAFVELPDTTFDLMMGFLRQNAGHFSRRAREREFKQLTDDEAHAIEAIYQDLLMDKIEPVEHGKA
ncbi:Fic family protein [Dongia deserti]|uniref:Fic family protein n=1 Tax=Dongia deserti TaxID=2268030 RepID=UPI000E65B418|nr:Fic family protein [Dongia deserti]